MSIEGGGVELGEHVDLVDAAVDAVAHGDINQPVAATDGHCWLGSSLGQGVQAGTSSSSQDDGCTHTAAVFNWACCVAYKASSCIHGAARGFSQRAHMCADQHCLASVC